MAWIVALLVISLILVINQRKGSRPATAKRNRNVTRSSIACNITAPFVPEPEAGNRAEIIMQSSEDQLNNKSLSLGATCEGVRKSPKTSHVISLKFKPYDTKSLGSSLLEVALRQYGHYISYYYIGTLSGGAKYSIMIGYSDTWVNVLALSRANIPTYKSYGFNILEKRWAYANNVLGAPQIREFIKNNISEVTSLMETQSRIRVEKKLEKKARAAEWEARAAEWKDERAKVFAKQKEKVAAYEKRKIEVIAQRRPLIEQLFTGLTFEFNQNKQSHDRALKAAMLHYCDLDIYSQTCSCDSFRSGKSNFSINDARRLCCHLHNVIWFSSLLKNKKDFLEDYVLKNSKSDVWGVYFFTGEGKTRFAIIAYTDKLKLDVAMPKKDSEGYVMTSWQFEEEGWTGKGGSKYLREVVKSKLEELFDV